MLGALGGRAIPVPARASVCAPDPSSPVMVQLADATPTPVGANWTVS